jgi:hypothetical protein
MNLRQFMPHSSEGYAACFGAATVAIIVASLASIADAGGYRQRAVCNVVRAPVYQQAAVIAYPGVIGYQASQYLQQRAVDTYGFRQSDEWQEYQQLLGERRGTDKVLAALAARPTDSAAGSGSPPQPEQWHPPATEEGQTTEVPQAFSAPQPPAAPDGAPQPPLAPAAQSDIAVGFAASFPRWQAVCAGCHSGQEPKGDVDIANAVHQAFAEDSCEAREHFARLVADGEMPKGKPLDDAAKGALLLELYRSK